MRTLELHDLVHAVGRSGNRMALFLGAGASVSSGIPGAPQLVDQWRREIYQRTLTGVSEQQYEGWLKDQENEYRAWLKEHHPEADADAKRYGYTFERVAPTRAQRQQRIAELCEAAMPKAGYCALAAIMDRRVLDTILTTNFDDLLADACFDVGSVRPQVSAHTETVRMMRLTSERPKIIKLHGDYLFDDLQNTDRETQSLRRGMEDILRQANHEFGLIVVGYGGNDDSIMGVLEGLDRGNPQGLFWCVRPGSEPNARVRALLERSADAFIVPIEGFDELMVELFRSLGGDLSLLEQRRSERGRHVQQTLQVLAGSQPVGEAVAQADDKLATLDQLLQAIELDQKGDFAGSEVAAKNVLDKEPDNSMALTVLTTVLFDRGDLDGAESAARRGLGIDPAFGPLHRILGVVLWSSGDLDGAESEELRALELEPDNVVGLNNLAIVLREKGDLGKAEETLQRALELDPNNPITWLNLASVLLALNREAEAEAAFRHTLKQVPDEPKQHSHRLAAGLAYAGTHAVGRALEAIRGWSGITASRLRPDAEIYLRFLAKQDHSAAQKVLSVLEASGLLHPQEGS